MDLQQLVNRKIDRLGRGTPRPKHLLNAVRVSLPAVCGFKVLLASFAVKSSLDQI
jgi:hypothetical protein